MKILGDRFLTAVSFLGMYVVERPSFDYDAWSSALPLLPRFIDALKAVEEQHPGWLAQCKLAYQYVLCLPDFDLEGYAEHMIDDGLPEPFRDFLTFVWEHCFPDEPWQREFPEDLEVDW